MDHIRDHCSLGLSLPVEFPVKEIRFMNHETTLKVNHSIVAGAEGDACFLGSLMSKTKMRV